MATKSRKQEEDEQENRLKQHLKQHLEFAERLNHVKFDVPHPQTSEGWDRHFKHNLQSEL